MLGPRAAPVSVADIIVRCEREHDGRACRVGQRPLARKPVGGHESRDDLARVVDDLHHKGAGRLALREDASREVKAGGAHGLVTKRGGARSLAHGRGRPQLQARLRRVRDDRRGGHGLLQG